MNFLVRPPHILRSFYKGSMWRMDKNFPLLYLTFDDGPVPEVTPWVLEVLNHYKVKATFFCVGENIQKHTGLFEEVKKQGHQIGNHTYHHLKGWKTQNNVYFNDVEQCQVLTQTNLFRPPYGRITHTQYHTLSTKYKIVFWDVLSHDYNPSMSTQQCLDNCIKYTRNGSIIVFHDSLKAKDKLKHILPLYLEHFLKLNYKFATL